eukprot:297846-Chlamydomonas_euryale.AAC.19
MHVHQCAPAPLRCAQANAAARTCTCRSRSSRWVWLSVGLRVGWSARLLVHVFAGVCVGTRINIEIEIGNATGIETKISFTMEKTSTDVQKHQKKTSSG